MSKSDTEEHFAVADKMLSRQLQWIAAADGKVTPVFAIDAAMLGVLAALVPPIGQWSISAAITASLAGVPLVGSIACLALAAFPRLSGPKGSLTFFGGITTLSEGDYLKRMSSGVNQDLIEDIYRQVYRNAEIAAGKYSFIKWAMILMFGSVPFWLIAVWLMYPGKFGL